MSYVMMDTRSIGDLELVPTELRVLSVLLSVADRMDESRSRISTTLLAQRAGMSSPNTSRVLTALRKRNVIFKEGPGYWRVNPWYAFAGEWTEWDKVAKKFPEPIWKRGDED